MGTMNYMGGSKNAIVARARRKKPNVEDVERKQKGKHRLESAARRANLCQNNSSISNEWQFEHARNTSRSLAARIPSSSTGVAPSNHSYAPSKTSLQRKKKALLAFPGSLVGIDMSSDVPANIALPNSEHASEAVETRPTASTPIISSPPVSQFEITSSLASFRSPTEIAIDALDDDPAFQYETMISTIEQLDCPPVVLSFLHPCMLNDSGFPAKLQRVVQNTGLKSHKLDWPTCLKQMWAV